jgi:DNA-binding SARP family transcriptional activator
VEILDNGENILPTAPKPRQVISLLLLRRNAVVRIDELVCELWEDRPPTSAMTTLQTYIYKLRKTLMERQADELLSTRPGGYMLKVPESSIDLHRFEMNASEGQAMLKSGDPSGAAETLRGALAMWRGQALVDVVKGELLSSYTTRLEEHRLRTLEQRIEADLWLGRHRELVSELKSLMFIYPLHEHLHALLMIALYRSGRRSEALEVYQELRRNMVEDLGLEPGKDLIRLQQSLLSDTPLDKCWPTLQSSPGEAAPVILAAPVTGNAVAAAAPVTGKAVTAPVTGKAVVLAAPVTGNAVAAAAPVTGKAVFVPAQLPPDITEFTGRATLVKEITSRLTAVEEARTAPPMTVIAGMAGVGKTALAIHVGQTLCAHFTDGQLYADLRDSCDSQPNAANVLRDFLRTLGVAESEVPESLDERSKLFRSATAHRRLLMVLDDVSSLAEVSPLLPSGSQCAVVMTTRHRLHGLTESSNVMLDVLDDAESIELLTHLTGRDHLKQAPQAVGGLVKLVGRLPLALRCIGSRLAMVPGYPVTEMVDQLARSRRILDLFRIGHLDLRSRYAVTYGRLSYLEQNIFCLLSLLDGADFTIKQAAAALVDWDPASVEGILERLTDNHLIQIVSYIDGEIHYSFHPLILSYARERLIDVLAGEYREKAPPELVSMEGLIRAVSY